MGEPINYYGFAQRGRQLAEPNVPDRLIVSVAGVEKSGKTHLALTAPGPIFYFDVDSGTEGVVHKFQAEKQIIVYPVRYSLRDTQSNYAKIYAPFLEEIRAAAKVGQGTIIFDTFTEVYELARLAHFGKLSQVQPHQYGVAYTDLKEIIRLIYDSGM